MNIFLFYQSFDILAAVYNVPVKASLDENRRLL